MANEFIKPEIVLGGMLGVLQRDTVLLTLIATDLPPGASFKYSKNDTVSLKVPAYVTARTRTLRGGTALIKDGLDETKVDVVLNKHIYKLLGISDEELTLDISDFSAQITAPVMSSIVRQVDDTIAAEMAATNTEVEVDLDPDDPYTGLVDARIALNNANVPASQRFLAVGSNVEAAFLKSDRLAKFDNAGPMVTDAMREATIGRIAGFTAVSVPGLEPDIAIAAHRTAYVAALIAPIVPQGAAWGAVQTFNGVQMRTLRDYDPTGSDGPEDRFLADTFMGTGVTADRGTIDDDGKFQATVTGDDAPIVVRAVKCTLTGS